MVVWVIVCWRKSGCVCHHSPGNLRYMNLEALLLQHDIVVPSMLYPWVCYGFLYREAICLPNDAVEGLSDCLGGFKEREITV